VPAPSSPGRRFAARLREARRRGAADDRRGVRRPSLLVQFGVVSAVLVIGLGLVLGSALEDTVQQRALAQAEDTAAGMARLAVQPVLSPADFAAGEIAPQRLADLRETLRGVTADGSVERLKVFDRRGTLLYSDETRLIGQRSTSDDLDTALAGGTASEIEAEDHEHSERGLGTLLEVYVPVRNGTSTEAEVLGAFELYLPYAPIAAGVAEDVRQLTWRLVLGLLALWAGLLQVMVTASRRLREHADTNAWLARHDTLTGLPNRALFTERLDAAVRSARRTGSGVAVLLVDLDRFQQVNDTLGHHFGDALLHAVGARLRAELGEDDTGAHLGADEFAVLLPGFPDHGDDTTALDTAARLLAGLRQPFVVDGVSLEVDASIGIACFPDHGDDQAELLQRADIALALAKQGHDDVVTFRPEYDVHTPQRLALFGELRRAIDEGQLLLHYQPKVSLSDGRVTGMEALVRWEHPVHGMLLPADFVPVAERTGLVRPMTDHLLDLAMRDCRTWRACGVEVSVAVNLSARSLLDGDLPVRVDRLLRRHDLPARALELEVTETTAMTDPAHALEVLLALRALGVRLSVDDFGTGHASLSYLHQLPVDALKIDRTFVSALHADAQEPVIVKSTIELGHNLRLQVVAEGVETEAAFQRLRALGCDEAQGYWLSYPVEAALAVDTVRALEHRLAPRPVALTPPSSQPREDTPKATPAA
jgi:diguanylate cyclase (GGDEF)-like protein